jgi:protein TonB
MRNSTDHRPVPVPASDRAVAGVLTVAIYGLLVLIWHGPFGVAPKPKPIEIVTRLVPNVPIKKMVLEPPPFVTHLIHPPVQSVAPPAFTVATEAPPAPLPTSAAASSELAGGASDDKGQGGSANGRSGNGSALSGCWDAVWAAAVRDRIGHFYYYPERASHNHVTGVVHVRMLIRQNGRLDRVEIYQSSGNRLLDGAATDMVRKAQPLPAIPERMHADKVDAEMPIAFGPPDIEHPTAESCNR